MAIVNSTKQKHIYTQNASIVTPRRKRHQIHKWIIQENWMLGIFIIIVVECSYEFSSVVFRDPFRWLAHFSTGQTANSCHLFILLCLCNVKNISATKKTRTVSLSMVALCVPCCAALKRKMPNSSTNCLWHMSVCMNFHVLCANCSLRCLFR